MQRLIEAICGSAEDDDSQTLVDKISIIASTKNNRRPPEGGPSPRPPDPQPNPEPEPPSGVPLSEISSLKKELKRLVNKRAIAVAGRLGSGANQDEVLKELEARVMRAEGELAQFRMLLQNGQKKIEARRYFLHT